MIKNLAELFNNSVKEISKDKKLIKGIERLGEYTDLKLYDICCEFEFETEEDYRKFETFCSYSFEDFSEFLDKKNLKMEHIGRTSTFRLIDKKSKLSYYYGQEWEDKTLQDKVIMLLQEFLSYNNINIQVEEKLYKLYDITYDDIDDFDYHYDMTRNSDSDFIKDFKNFIKYEVEYLEEGYNYIEDFKKNQIDYYKEFLQAWA